MQRIATTRVHAAPRTLPDRWNLVMPEAPTRTRFGATGSLLSRGEVRKYAKDPSQ